MASSEPQEKSLLEFLDSPQLDCLNEAAEHPLKGILEDKVENTNSEKYLLSDVDQQLLLSLYFNQGVRVRSLMITSKNVSQAPKRVKLVVNRPVIGFEDVQDAEDATQILELTNDQVREGKKIPLRFVKFQSVNSLHIFVEANQTEGAEDKTRIDALDVFGSPLEAKQNLGNLNPIQNLRDAVKKASESL